MSDAPLSPGSLLIALQADRRWIGWRWEPVKGKPKPTKVPYMPGGGRRKAATDDPETWSTYENASAMQGVDGIGYVLSGRSGLVAFDLDHCRDETSGALAPWAQDLVDAACSYTEITPSQTGLRIIGLGNGLPTTDAKLPRGPNGEKVEIYLNGPPRYICMTFDALGTDERPLADITAIARQLLDEHNGRASASAQPPPGADSADLTGLPPDIALLIQSGPPAGADRSRELFKAVAAMRDAGWPRTRIVSTLRAYPNGVAARCFEGGKDNTQRQVDQCLHKIDDDRASRTAKGPAGPQPSSGAAIRSIADLQLKTFPPLQRIAGDVVVEGLTILAGRPKVGKSWMVLDIALAVAGGRYCLGDIQCQPGDVLLLALEDNERRLQSRITRILGLSLAEWPTRMSYATAWPRAGNGGLDLIRRWIAASENARLIVIDVLGAFRDRPPPGKQSYDLDFEAIRGLQAIASETGVAIVIVHHLRKSEADDPIDTVSGTLGLAGGADTILVLNRNAQGVTLYGRGRDVEEFDKALQFDPQTCRWTILGETAEVQRSQARNEIVAALEETGEPMSPKDIGDAVGRPGTAVRRLLLKMATAGEVTRVAYGRYTKAPATPGNSGHTGNSSEDRERE